MFLELFHPINFSEYDDFTVKNKLNAITEVWEPGEKCNFVILGTIKGILQNKKWYYQACTNCFGKAVPSYGGELNRCSNLHLHEQLLLLIFHPGFFTL
uniref:Uncharacterized protein n=1 Tax=Lactuca sativa TaxID=4236 RepID=A0A9R1VRQ2_LACSA|nr:hypothetical protein LSAT_V11C400182100 [Lactuca sativa]